jgi:peptidyl-prolyl cis-trans isomerase SurA
MVASGVAPSQFREDLRSQLLLQRLRERELQQRVRVTEADIDQFLREQQADTRPAELTLAQVLVAVPENATPEQLQQLQAKAAEVLRRARAGEDFAQLARQLSDAPEARAGGVLGQRTADRWPELFVDAVRGLPAGGIANVVRSGAGFHVLKLVERRDAGAAVVTQSRARHILLRPGPRLTEQQARERLADYRRRVVTGQAEFAALAREFSQDGSASAGGDLGWAAPGQFVPEFEEVLNQMRPGDISAPVVSRFGVHLIQLLERRQATLSVREQREVARNVLREKKLDEAYAQWAQEVRGRAWVEFREPPS